ncbi:hypothetical protein [Roseomonas marmotae]|uniref:Uncharacterized protein n=1 Tax=Roseomonas marmotae TaxID=2768161 RepID=A0ABS3KHU4_9PROT|nr:hypothetical protein [Roseomonas marmotae]MBO1076188.1 hypothetical protein [Roseomonas marmotae]QTI81776.1 hypothetical protein IAI58_20685 [Roseomonas marmotae]
MARTVLIADLPQTLEDLIAGILSRRAEVTVVRGATGTDGLLSAARKAGAGVVVVARTDPADPFGVDPAYGTAAGIAVLSLSPNASWACLHRLLPSHECFEDVSVNEIVDAVLGKAG